MTKDWKAATDATTDGTEADALALWHFVGRTDVHAVQYVRHKQTGTPQSQFRTVYKPLTAEALARHLRGDITLGTYTVREDGTCRYVVLDWDFPGQVPSTSEMRRRIETALTAFAALGHPATAYLLEFSGRRGFHAWIFFDSPIPQEVAYRYGQVLKQLTSASEAFPKQPRHRPDSKKLGNVVKLPCAVHRLSGRRSYLIDDDGNPDPRPLAEIIAVIDPVRRETVERVAAQHDRTANSEAGEYWTGQPEIVLPRVGPAPERRCLERVLAAGVNESERRGRQTWAWKLGLYFKERGHPLEEGCDRIIPWSGRCRPPLYPDEATRQVENAYRGDYQLPKCGDMAYCVPHSCPLFLSEHPELAQGCGIEDFADYGWARHFGPGWKSALAVYTGIVVLERRKGKRPGDSFLGPLGELGEAAGVSKQTASRVLRKLGKAGLIAYVPGEWRTKRAAEIARALPIPLPPVV